MTFILAIDQGTTSTRSIVFNSNARALASAQAEFPQHYPAPGWVEHDPEDLWTTTLATARDALARAKLAVRDIAGIGITNQRETTLVWDRESGRPIHKAIVWQDRRTAEMCARLRQGGHEAMVAERSGLLIDPYFSGTKIAWMLDHVPGARERAAAGKLAFGTVDTWLLWRMTEGRVHATDATNACRTLLLNLATGDWDDELLRLLRIPRAMLPEVKDSAARFGTTRVLGGAADVLGIAGDQQAALVGQACFEPGMLKSTYGTGCFALLNTGTKPVASTHRLLSTIGYQLKGQRTYALEGSIFVAGAAVQWLRDGLGIIGTASESGALADDSDPAQAVVMVPAFTGMGAPYWKPEARGAIFGITRGTTKRELARAALEAVGFQTLDLLEAMRADWRAVAGDAGSETVVRVDGGMTASDWAMQFLADVLAAPVDRPAVLETTALGAAFLAGLEAGVFPDPEAFASTWALERRFNPVMDGSIRGRKIASWRDAVARTLHEPG